MTNNNEPTQAELLAQLVKLQEADVRRRGHRNDLWIYIVLGVVVLAVVLVGLGMAVS